MVIAGRLLISFLMNSFSPLLEYLSLLLYYLFLKSSIKLQLFLYSYNEKKYNVSVDFLNEENLYGS